MEADGGIGTEVEEVNRTYLQGYKDCVGFANYSNNY